MNKLRTSILSLSLIFFLFAVIALTGCTGQTGARSVQGAGTGAAAGAVGGMVSALVFGGNVGDALAHGAVWGASTGAVSGAIVGHQEDNILNSEEEKAAKTLENKLGEDAYSGLMALSQCKYTVAFGYAQIAQQQENTNYVLAGLWLEALLYQDQGETAQAEAMFPAIEAADPHVSSKDEAVVAMDKAMQGLLNIRNRHTGAATCK